MNEDNQEEPFHIDNGNVEEYMVQKIHTRFFYQLHKKEYFNIFALISINWP